LLESDSFDPLGAIAGEDEVFQHWFGHSQDLKVAFDDAEFVLSTFSKILRQAQRSDVRFRLDLTLPSNVLARTPGCEPYGTYPWDLACSFVADPRITLGPLFFTRPMAGDYKTRPGILVHEYSHEVAGTHDWTYNLNGALDLAENNPHLAAHSADNYAFAVEYLFT
jgi:hypothetical protein